MSMAASPTADPYPITPKALEAELDSLLKLRRRSLSLPTEGVNPDLVSPASPTSPTSAAVAAAEHGSVAEPPPTSSYSSTSPPLVSPTSSDEPALETEDKPLNSLFWLPARLHPEIAPQEFRNFIRDHSEARGYHSRENSLSRRKSMLSRQYTPSDKDEDDEDDKEIGEKQQKVKPIRRRSNAVRRGDALEKLENITIADLQRLEVLAKQAESESDQNIGNLVRRSLSLNPAHLVNAADELDSKNKSNAPIDEADSPLVAHQPGSILRRSARTRVRKSSVQGDVPSRLGSRRARISSLSAGKSTASGDPNRSSITSLNSSEESHEHATPSSSVPASASLDNTSATLTGDSNNADKSIIEPVVPSSDVTSIPTTSAAEPSSWVSQAPIEDSAQSITPTDQAQESGTSAESYPGLKAPSPPPIEPTNVHPQHKSMYAPEGLIHQAGFVPMPEQMMPERPPSIKQKKSGWARLGLSRSASVEDEEAEGTTTFSSKKSKKDKKAKAADVTINEGKSGPSEGKELGFFGALFTKKKSDPLDMPLSSTISQALIAPTASGMLQNGRYTNFYRLPIHIERAVYRLSHIKLANPRRPLYEQVLISNLMFWYLSVINRPAGPYAAARAANSKNPNLSQQQYQQENAPQPEPSHLSQSSPGELQPETTTSSLSTPSPTVEAPLQQQHNGFQMNTSSNAGTSSDSNGRTIVSSGAVRNVPFEHSNSVNNNFNNNRDPQNSNNSHTLNSADVEEQQDESSFKTRTMYPRPVTTRTMPADQPGFEVVRRGRQNGPGGSRNPSTKSNNSAGVTKPKRPSLAHNSRTSPPITQNSESATKSSSSVSMGTGKAAHRADTSPLSSPPKWSGENQNNKSDGSRTSGGIDIAEAVWLASVASEENSESEKDNRSHTLDNMDIISSYSEQQKIASPPTDTVSLESEKVNENHSDKALLVASRAGDVAGSRRLPGSGKRKVSEELKANNNDGGRGKVS